jgi:MFS family permease
MGPPLGGILIDAWGWRSVFWINLPLCIAAWWLTSKHVPESRDETEHGPLDWRGALLAVAAFGALTVGLVQLADASRAISAASLLGVGTVGLVLLVRYEARTANPLLQLSLFRNRVFSGVNAMTMFLYGALSAVLFLLPFDLIARRDLSATQVGLTLAPFGVIVGALSSVAGKWSDRHGPRAPLISGSLLLAVATSALAMNIEPFWSGVVGPIVLMSLAMGMVVSPLTTAVMNAAPDAHAGAASGINNATSRLAGLFAVAIAGSLANMLFHRALDGVAMQAGTRAFGDLPALEDHARAVTEAAFGHAYSTAMWMLAAWNIAAALLACRFVPAQAAAQANGS